MMSSVLRSMTEWWFWPALSTFLRMNEEMNKLMINEWWMY